MWFGILTMTFLSFSLVSLYLPLLSVSLCHIVHDEFLPIMSTAIVFAFALSLYLYATSFLPGRLGVVCLCLRCSLFSLFESLLSRSPSLFPSLSLCLLCTTSSFPSRASP